MFTVVDVSFFVDLYTGVRKQAKMLDWKLWTLGYWGGGGGLCSTLHSCPFF